MGRCIYCNKWAGFFRDKHPECEKIHTVNVNTKNAIAKTDMEKPFASHIQLGAGKAKARLENTSGANSLLKKYQPDLEKIPTPSKNLATKLHGLLTLEEIEIINELWTLDIYEHLSWNTRPYDLLLSSLGKLGKNGHVELCEKLFQIIDEYIETDKKATVDTGLYHGQKIDVYWNNNDFIKVIELCEEAQLKGKIGNWTERVEKARRKLQRLEKNAKEDMPNNQMDSDNEITERVISELKEEPIARATEEQGGEMTTRETVTESSLPGIYYVEEFKIHDDIKYLLWFGDGIYQNITKAQMNNSVTYSIGNYKVKIPLNGGLDLEPSLIFMNMPIKQPADEMLIPRPSYYPHYANLTPEQRWIYLKLLTNPYDSKINIGYVFILYYGLERHLLHGDFHSAFNVILKLRDVHKNKSFQSYSGDALILSALWRGKGDYIPLFIKSLWNEREYHFSVNLLLMCYYSFNVPFQSKDLMLTAREFLFAKTNYIKNNPDVFENCLKETIQEKTGLEYVNLKHFFTDIVVENLRRFDTIIYANTSLVSTKISIPVLITNVEFKGHMLMYLTCAHDKTKQKLAEVRKKQKRSKTESP